jgi:hypothetical protein
MGAFGSPADMRATYPTRSHKRLKIQEAKKDKFRLPHLQSLLTAAKMSQSPQKKSLEKSPRIHQGLSRKVA